MLNVFATVCNNDGSVCYWQFNADYASNSIFSGATLRDYMFYGTDHQPMIRTQYKAIQFQHMHSNLLPNRH